MKILFVGSNPSASSPDCTPFHPSCRSRKTLDGWISGVNNEIVYMNVSDNKTPGNRSLSAKEIRESIPSLREKLLQHSNHKIVAVGTTATKAMHLIGCTDFLSVPHPSGRCRKLNDADFVARTKITLISFIKG